MKLQTKTLVTIVFTCFFFISATSTTKNTVAVSLTIFNTIDLLNSM